eukprot:CAMPEP_0178413896 /NCGR_PEP_ID=MMETSP0689_2-20121128/22761_1 /TAXON_ID=160604 /ORGANISM="Amphidinium massartii, Strain CS-259" /LENGTH=370 /DNA_ID=CAMNT_0020035177 /DNA_START=55 /DNA_END=1164 /DNA_ORIENTATION=-
MADDWDPFEIVDAPSEPANVKKAPQSDRLASSDRTFLVNTLYSMLCKDAPWGKVPDTRPDLLWHTPTATSTDWLHKDVKLEVSQGIAYVIFNRPTENNSMNDTLGAGINDALYALHARPDLRVAVFTGEGRMYCAGGDPKAWQAAAAAAKGIFMDGDGTVGHRIKMNPPTEEVIANQQALGSKAHHSGLFPSGVELSRLFAAKQWHTWLTLPQFTISLVNGSAMGGGVGCVCCCDYVIALRKAFLVLSEVKIGVIPATISPYVISKMGTSNAKRLFCTAENMKAERAKEVGIVDEVVDKLEQGHERIKEICSLVSACGPKSVIAAKDLCLAVSGQPVTESLMFYIAERAAASAASPEAKLGKEAESAGKQ